MSHLYLAVYFDILTCLDSHGTQDVLGPFEDLMMVCFVPTLALSNFKMI